MELDIPEEMKLRTESHGLDLNQMVAEVLAEVFGKCWDSLGGLIKFHGSATVSINGTHKYPPPLPFIESALRWHESFVMPVPEGKKILGREIMVGRKNRTNSNITNLGTMTLCPVIG